MKTVLSIVARYMLVWVVAVLGLGLAASLLPGFYIDTGVDRWQLAVVRMPIVFAVLLILLRPVLMFLTLPLNSLTLGLPTLLFNGLILFVTARAEPAVVINNVGDAWVGALVITVISTGVVGWLGLDEAYPFYQSLIYRIGRRYGPQTATSVSRGLLILQIDGLSYPSLLRALERGRMPTITAMLAKGSHRLHRWYCGIPSNTPAVQAGFMYGDRQNVPGYRWFDRKQQKLRVVSNPEDLRALEEMVAEGSEPLLAGGSCINSFLSGGAVKRLLTVSAVGLPDDLRRAGEKADFNLFFVSPNAYTKAVLNSLWDYLSGLVLATAGRLRKDRPKLKFSIRRVAQQAVANSFLRDLSFFWLKQDMSRGVPIIYSNFVGYDDVAHYSAPDAYQAQVALAAFDRRLRRLRRRARHQGGMQYDMVILSDHGQTPSVPFRLLYGQTIEEVLEGLFEQLDVHTYDRSRAFDPDASYTASLLAELEDLGAGDLNWAAGRGVRALTRIQRPTRTRPRIWRRSTTSPDQAARSKKGRTQDVTPGKSDVPGVVVCVSGSLAHIYFTGHRAALHLEEICTLYPGLVDELAQHPGIGFVAASRQYGDAVAIGDNGIRNLITGARAGGRDPLAPYGEPDRWAGELAQLLGFADSGDLVVNGSWLPESNRIVVLEEQTSSHGGLGGWQNEPFVLLPADWSASAMDLESPEALHGLLYRHRPEPSERRGRRRERAG